MKKLLLILLFVIKCFSIDEIIADDVKLNLLNATTNDDEAIFTNAETQNYIKSDQKRAKKVKTLPKINMEAFSDAIILNNINKREQNTKITTIQKKTSFYASTDNLLAQKRKTELEANIEANKIHKTMKLVTANCMVHQNIKVSLKDFMKLSCQLVDSDEIIEVFGSYISDSRNFSLLGKIDYIVRNKKVYKVTKETYMTNALETSYNLATTVNTRAIEKVNTTLIKSVTSEMANEGKSILGDIKQSNQQQETVYDQNGNPVMATTNTKPSTSDITERVFYSLVIGALDGVSQIADKMEEKLPFLYQINKGSFLKANIFINSEDK